MIKKVLVAVLFSSGLYGYGDNAEIQKALDCALLNKSCEGVLRALQQGARPTYTMSVNGTRTMRQVNALNFALRVYEDDRKQGEALLQAMLSRLTPEEYSNVLNYLDQEDQQTPYDVMQQLFPQTDSDEFLGSYIKRTNETFFGSTEWLNEI